MALNLVDLDFRTRVRMVEEFVLDEENGTLYFGRFLTEDGKKKYPNLFRMALQDGDDGSFALALRQEPA